jgi:hypothetical protein
MSLEPTFIFRETMVVFAVIFCLKGQFDTGDKKRSGWIYMMIGGIFWGIFAVMVQSPMSFTNNILYMAFSYRGWKKWRNEDESC